MRTICPVCGIEGLLQQRGNSKRIQHYTRHTNGKRTFIYHKIETNGNNALETKTLKIKLNNRFRAGREGFEPSTSSLEGWRSIRAELTTHV